MKKYLAPLVFIFSSFHGLAQDKPTWVRYPAISPDGNKIAFTYKGDIYTVPTKGGAATPITRHEAHDFMPVWSHDGKKLAFASDRYGNFDIFCVDARGGVPKRITFHSANEYPYTFTRDNNNIVFGAVRLDAAESRNYPTAWQPELYYVSANGGRVFQLLSSPAEDVNFCKKGNLMLYHDKKGGENAWRKHQTSSIARDIWMYNTQTKTHTKLTDFEGEDRSPIFTDNDQAFYYLSEESGTFNIHKKNVSGGKSQQLTSFKKHPVRFLSMSENGVLAFSWNGELYVYENGGTRKVEITILTDQSQNYEDIVKVSGGSNINVAANNKEIVFIYRGDVFVNSIENGITKQITRTVGQEAAPVFSPDGQTIVYSAERNGKWSIYQSRRVRKDEPYFFASTLIEENPLIENNNDNTQPQFSPDGKEIAFIENKNRLKVYNIESKKIRNILVNDELFAWGENAKYFQWSPDGKWFLFNYDMPGSAAGEIGIVSSDGKGKAINLTKSGFNDSRAKWVLDGKAMIWFSNRDGLRGAAMSGGQQQDVYVMFFNKEAWEKFNLSKADAALLKDIEAAKAKADTSKKNGAKADSSLKIDWEDIDIRKQRLTIHSSTLGDALLSKDGETLYYLARFEKGFNLWSTNLKSRETKMLIPLNAGGASMTWDKDHKIIYLTTDGSIIKIDPLSGKQDRVVINGEMRVDILAERQFQFEHVWRKTKNTFYTASMHNVDWDSYKKDYARYIPSIGNNYEFAELLSELLGELNVSHSGASYSRQVSNADATAALGILYDYSYTGDGVRIVEILKGGPLDKSNIHIPAGSILRSVDGIQIKANNDLSEFLNRKTGVNTLLVFEVEGKEVEYVIKPISISEENTLLYRRWIKRNQEEVDKLSNGQLGYVHIPGMNDGAYRSVYEEVMGKYFDKKALVVDTRFNAGGDLVGDLDMFLSGKKFMDYGTDKMNSGFEPNFRWTKPSISIVNEANYSDGHCYAYMISAQKINKLVGMPVPGTCTFAGWAGLMDSGIRWGVPPVGVKAMNGKYLENWQTEPDVKVANEAAKVVNGIDQQLEAAVKELLKDLK
ncbi:MAG TPA: S41 family peptidase [Parasegetibacter sp.]